MAEARKRKDSEPMMTSLDPTFSGDQGPVSPTAPITGNTFDVDDPDGLIALAQRSFDKAAKAAVAENDGLGIPTHGAISGTLVVRQLPRVRKPYLR